MTKTKRILSAAIAGVLAFSVMSACAKKGGSGDDYLYTPTAPTEYKALRGVHTDASTATADYLLHDGVCEYTLVTPSGDEGDTLTPVVNEFVRYFAESTGVLLTAVRDTGLRYSADGKYISLGNTALKPADVTLAAEFSSDAFRIVTRGKSIFAVGKTETGTQYGAYELLYRLCGLEWLHPDCYAIEKNVTDIPLMQYDITENPDFSLRYGTIYRSGDRLTHFRQRTQWADEYIKGDWRTDSHNSLSWFTEFGHPENDIRSHSKWMANAKPTEIGSWQNGLPSETNKQKEQICFNANGDQEERELMLECAFKKVKSALTDGLPGKYVPLSIEDNFFFCECDACTHMVETYGAYSATALKFMGDLAQKVRDWFSTVEGAPYERELKYILLIYTSMWDAPDKGGFTIDKDVTVQLAPIQLDYTSSLTAPVNQDVMQTVDTWERMVGSEMGTWFYNTNFYYYLVPYDNFNTIRELCQYFASKRVGFFFSQGQGEVPEPSGFAAYKAYLLSKYQWNSHDDAASLKDRWFRGYFCEAYEPMLGWFNNMQAWYAHLRTLDTNPLGGIKRSIYQEMLKEEYFPKYVLDGWMTYADEAIAAIEPLKATDMTRYRAIYDRICRERLSVIYLLNELYSATYAPADLKELRRTFVNDAARVNTTKVCEHNGLITTYTARWDI